MSRIGIRRSHQARATSIAASSSASRARPSLKCSRIPSKPIGAISKETRTRPWGLQRRRQRRKKPRLGPSYPTITQLNSQFWLLLKKCPGSLPSSMTSPRRPPCSSIWPSWTKTAARGAHSALRAACRKAASKECPLALPLPKNNKSHSFPRSRRRYRTSLCQAALLSSRSRAARHTLIRNILLSTVRARHCLVSSTLRTKACNKSNSKTASRMTKQIRRVGTPTTSAGLRVRSDPPEPEARVLVLWYRWFTRHLRSRRWCSQWLQPILSLETWMSRVASSLGAKQPETRLKSSKGYEMGARARLISTTKIQFACKSHQLSLSTEVRWPRQTCIAKRYRSRRTTFLRRIQPYWNRKSSKICWNWESNSPRNLVSSSWRAVIGAEILAKMISKLRVHTKTKFSSNNKLRNLTTRAFCRMCTRIAARLRKRCSSTATVAAHQRPRIKTSLLGLPWEI